MRMPGGLQVGLYPGFQSMDVFRGFRLVVKIHMY